MTGLTPIIRETGRWAKRERLKLLRRVSADKIRYNNELNQREIWHQRTRLESFPRMIQVGTNWTCNLKCFFCRRETTDRERLAGLSREELTISADTLERLMAVLPYVEIFTLTPLGEPLQYRDLPRLLERYKAAGCLNLQLTTNGNILTERQAEMLVDAHVFRIYFSIDSADPATYAEMRIGGDLQTVSRNLRRLNEWKARLESPYPELIIASTFMRRNIEQLPGLVQFAHEHQIKQLSVQLMEDEDAGIEAETLVHHIPATIRGLRAGKQLADALGVELLIHLALRNLLSANKDQPGVRELLTDEPAIDTRGKTLLEKCQYPFTFMVIDTDSDSRPCCWIDRSYGNLSRNTFDEIWNSPAALELRGNFHANRIPGCCRKKHCRVDLDE